MRILIVEDDEKMRHELALFLTNNGYNSIELNNFTNVIYDIQNIMCDLILLDINLPNIDGKYVCKELRKNCDTPIIMVTSKNSDFEELVSINSGADDYITKPYNPQILLARIERVFERMNTKTNIIRYKELVVDVSKSIISYNDLIIELSRNEIKILYFLLQNKGQIVSRDNLVSYLWDNNEYVDDNTLTVNVNRLRNKLKQIGYENMIDTKRAQGYIIL